MNDRPHDAPDPGEPPARDDVAGGGDGGLDPEPTEEELAALRGELADLRVDSPVPDEVAARLDRTFAELTAGGVPDPSPAPEPGPQPEETRAPAEVVPLRRRWAPRVLGAAAAVVLVAGVGVGVGTVLDRSSDSDSQAGSTAAEAPESRPQDAGPEDAERGDASGEAGDAPGAALGEAVLRLTRADLDAQAARLLDPQRAEAAPQSTLSSDPSFLQQLAACPGPDDLRDEVRRLPVLLDGTPALAVVRDRAGSGTPVEVWACSGEERLARTVVPGR